MFTLPEVASVVLIAYGSTTGIQNQSSSNSSSGDVAPKWVGCGRKRSVRHGAGLMPLIGTPVESEPKVTAEAIVRFGLV